MKKRKSRPLLHKADLFFFPPLAHLASYKLQPVTHVAQTKLFHCAANDSWCLTSSLDGGLHERCMVWSSSEPNVLTAQTDTQDRAVPERSPLRRR